MIKMFAAIARWLCRTLEDTKFLVGGARVAAEMVQLPPVETHREGVRACITAAKFRQTDETTFDVVGGRVVVP